MDKNKYSNDIKNYSLIDNKLSHAQMAIGTSSNIAQIAQTYMYNFEDEKFRDYVCILSVVAQISIDNAKRSFDIDVVKEIDRIRKDMDIDTIGYPSFWKHIKDKKVKIGGKKFNQEKINENLVCPMNYLMNLKFANSRSNESTLPMSHFFNKFELEEDRRQCKKVETLIEKYSLDLFDTYKEEPNYHSENELNLLLREDFDDLVYDIQQTYMSKTYLGLMSWLIDRAFIITPSLKQNKNEVIRKTNENKSLLLKVLYNVNKNNLLKIFSKNS